MDVWPKNKKKKHKKDRASEMPRAKKVSFFSSERKREKRENEKKLRCREKRR